MAHDIWGGVLWLNDDHRNDPRSVWGGVRDSGFGKENGWDALKAYLTKKSIVVRTEPRSTSASASTSGSRCHVHV